MSLIRCPECKGPLTLREWGTYHDESPVGLDGSVDYSSLRNVGNDKDGEDVWCERCQLVLSSQFRNDTARNRLVPVTSAAGVSIETETVRGTPGRPEIEWTKEPWPTAEARDE